MLCISCESPAEVDRITEAAKRPAARPTSRKRTRTKSGPMYGRDFEDPDGHQWAPMWMDPSFAEKGAHPVEEAIRGVTSKL